MGDLVKKERVHEPTCGQLFDKLRNIMEFGAFDGLRFTIGGFTVAQLITTEVVLNGTTYYGINILEKKPVREGLPEGMVELIGRHNGASIINGMLVGLGYDNGTWVVLRELHDYELSNFYSDIIGNNQIDL